MTSRRSTRRSWGSPRRTSARTRRFAAKHSLNVPLLADVDKQVAQAYDAYSPRLGVKRAVIVIDEQGVVRHRHDHLLGLDYQSVDELKAVLDELPAPAIG